MNRTVLAVIVFAGHAAVDSAPGQAAPAAAADYPELTVHAAPRPLPEGAVTSDWPGFLGPDRNGHSPETMLRRDFDDADPPGLVWSMERGQGYACPAVQGDRLVYTHRVGPEIHVDCLDAATGRRHWRHSYATDYDDRYVSDNGPRATPAIAGDRVYVHGVEGTMRCLDLASGGVVWKRELSKELGIGPQFFGVVSSPLVRGDLLIVNVGAPGGPSVAAFDTGTGELVWGAGDEWGPSCASPVVAEVHGRDRLFVMTGGDSRPPSGGLMVMDPDTGALDFTYPFRSRTYESVNGATPIIGDDRVFITASYSTGTAGLAPGPDGGFEELWKTRRLGLQFSTPLYVDGHLWLIDGRSDRVGSLVCLDPATGDVRSRTDVTWEETLFYRGKERTVPLSIGEGSMLLVEGRGLCLGDNGHLLWIDLDPAGATVLSRASLFRANESWSPPVLSRGLLYVCQNNRERFGRDPAPPRLLCFDLRGAAPR
jgi:outer membrane protein assembly factor BamB